MSRGKASPVVGSAEALDAINDLLSSVTIFNSASSQLLAGLLEDLVGDQLTLTQLRLLRLVDRQGVLTVGDVATYLGVSNAAASKAVDRLVRGGFLQRTEAEGDRRTMEVTVSAEGRALLTAFEARSNAVLLRLLSGVEVRRMRELSERLDRLSVDLAEAGPEPARVCFRCGLFFRDECLLRTLADRQCYLHLGVTRRGSEGRPAPRGDAGTRRVQVTTGGIG